MSQAATSPMSGPRRTPRAVAIIPARIGSTRLPRKMLLRETGRYLFEHTALAVAACDSIERVLVATDCQEVLDAALEVGLEGTLTSVAHKSGTDRVHEAYEQLVEAGDRFEVVIDVQGDEPDLAHEDLSALVAAFADPAVEIATLWAPIESDEEARATSVVKVVMDANADALYFSRAAIPASGHSTSGHSAASAPRTHRRHIGVYAFRPGALTRFAELPPGTLEQREQLEQLRWLEAGGRMRMVAASRTPRGIDTPADYADFAARVSGLSRAPADTDASPGRLESTQNPSRSTRREQDRARS